MIEVAYTTDENGVHDLVVSLASLVAHASPVSVHVLGIDLSAASWRLLEDRSRAFGVALHPIDLPEDHVGRSLPTFGRARTAWYGKIFLPHLVDRPHLVVLDSDTLVVDDLPLFRTTKMSGRPCAACPDEWLGRYYRRTIRRTERGPTLSRYVNAGVLVVDVAAWRGCDAQERIVSAARHPSPFLDQDALNFALGGSIGCLPREYNVQTRTLLRARRHSPGAALALRRARVLHFTGPFSVRSPGPWGGQRLMSRLVVAALTGDLAQVRAMLDDVATAILGEFGWSRALPRLERSRVGVR